MRIRLRATAAATVCSICIAASASALTIQTPIASPEQHRTVSTQGYVLTSNDGTLSPASIGSLATLPGVTTAAAPTAPAGSTWPSANPLVNLLIGPLQYDAKFSRSPVLASPFTIVNAPFQLLTGQSIASPDGTTAAPTVENLINAETKALGLLAGVPAAYVANTIAVVTAVSQNPGSLLPSGLSLSAPTASSVSPTAKTLAVTTAAAPTAPAGSTWPSANPLVNLLIGPLQYDAKFSRSPVLASPFTIVNAPFQLLTGQLIVNPDGTTAAPTIQNLINAETKAFGLLVGLPGAYVTNTIAVVTALTQNPASLLPSGLLPSATANTVAAKAPTSILSALGKTTTVDSKTVDASKVTESKTTGSKSSPEAEPTKADPAKPANPAEAATPVEPVKAATPAEPVKVTAPAEPVKPATAAEPVKVTAPAEPVKPVEAATPVEAIKPAAPAEPAKPATPADAVKPAEPKVNVPKVKLPTPATKVGEVSGGVAPKTEDSAKADKSEKADSKDTKSDKGSTPKKPENDSSAAKKPESAASATGKSESASSSSSSDSHSSTSNGSSHSDSHKASSD